MMPSRVVFAIIDAALIAGTLSSPPTIASPSSFTSPKARLGKRLPSTCTPAWRHREILDSAPHRQHRSREDVQFVDFSGGGPCDRPRQRAQPNCACQFVPATSRELLGIGESFDLIVRAQNYGTGYHRAREWSAPRFVDSGKEPSWFEQCWLLPGWSDGPVIAPRAESLRRRRAGLHLAPALASV